MESTFYIRNRSLKLNSNYFILILLCFGALFIKNPKFFGIAITDISILLGTLIAFTYRYPAKARISTLALLSIILLLILYVGIGVFKVPDKVIFLKYYARILKSFLVGILGYIFFIRLNTELQLRILKFFFYLAVVSIILDTIYSLYYFSTREYVNVWALYSSLKVSYLYADKNMVAFTISMLMVISYRFLDKKYLFLLLFLTIISLSRSGILINSLILFYIMGFKLIKPSVLIILISTLVVTIGLVYALDLSQMFIDRLSLNQDLSMSGRLGLQRMGLNMWLDSPLTGKGLSGYEQYFYNYFKGGEHTPFPHNLFIYILAELGLLGFILLTIILMVIWHKLNKKGLGMLVLAYLMFGMFLFNLTEYHFFFLIGLLLAYNSKSYQLENRIHSTIPC
ncbi:O-antigen ligase [Pontibacter aydingkolensis]|uniref:O-antigen ligase family protein n=1 Tax=Pontibacter aydingkolensis TaxID=1911536 RepID=A0ABS7CYV8_9BACT|nr:O-antigen ligase family protein [Pontibacter aydingkolensis]MBW7469034.1 O-antigen ligase family protein [Pontibacter aydingkolensis]